MYTHTHTQASTSDIRSAFHRLSREFHPDKTALEVQNLATELFPQLDRAYKVLTDATLRRIYDDYGEEGVEALEQNEQLSKALSLHLESGPSDEMLDVLAALLRQEKLAKLEHVRDSVHSTMSCMVDLTDCWESESESDINIMVEPEKVSLLTRLRRIHLDQMIMKHQMRFPMSYSESESATMGSFGGYLVSQHGMSHGALTGAIDYHLGPLTQTHTSVELGTSGSCELSSTISQQVSPFASASITSSVSDDRPLDLTLGLNQLISENTQASIQYGPSSGLVLSSASSLSLATGTAVVLEETELKQTIRKNVHTRASLLLNPNTGLGARASVKVQWTEMFSLKGFMNVSSNLMASTCAISGLQRFSPGSSTRFGLTCALSLNQGLVVKLRLRQGAYQDLEIPLRLTKSIFEASRVVQTLVLATVVPVVISTAVEQLLAPLWTQTKLERLERRLASRRAYLSQARMSALNQQTLMRRLAERHEQAWGSSGGGKLEILRAEYGALSATESEDEKEEKDRLATSSSSFDVSIPLYFFMNTIAETDVVSVQLQAGSKMHLLGFYNPCYGRTDVQPRLYVRYAVDGQVFEHTWTDVERVVIPTKFATACGARERILA